MCITATATGHTALSQQSRPWPVLKINWALSLTILPVAVLQLSAVHAGGVQHLDEAQGAVHPAHEQHVFGLATPQRLCLLFGPCQCWHPVWLHVQKTFSTLEGARHHRWSCYCTLISAHTLKSYNCLLTNWIVKCSYHISWQTWIWCCLFNSHVLVVFNPEEKRSLNVNLQPYNHHKSW